MKRIILAIGILGGVLGFMTGCGKVSTSDGAIALQQETQMQEAVRQTGLPAIMNFQEKKMLKMLYELRDQEDLVCYAYLVNELNGKIGQYLGRCIGYGLPASAQYSNPEKVIEGDKALGYDLAGYVNYPMTIPQAEPNGLFMPEGLSATWLMLIDPKTQEPRPVYIEPLIIVSPFPLHTVGDVSAAQASFDSLRTK